MSKKKKLGLPFSSPTPVLPLLMPPASASTLASSPLEIANRFTSLGQVPRPVGPSYFASTLAMPFDPYANPLATVRPRPTNRFPSANKAEYFKKAYFVNLFYIEKSIKTDPFEIAFEYFRRGFYWIPENPAKDLKFYLGILIHTGFISVKPIYCKVDPSKIIFHKCYLISVLAEEEWITHFSTSKTIKGTEV
ncbi:hypothetical protein I3842_06G039000 [Carya illinoinensis]|uniref:Uncharacterized protein n=1 Tax=Carya illinoinensis TaxID=32201 RepID=A0A922EP81_CARIL|nr:hypothetical protein I3842_06G039000 [Carya illinoinensis]